LLAEWDVEEIVGIACDGYGYGSDRTAWGGEVLYCNLEGFKRIAHLESQPMVGGDLATIYPLRMAAGILHGELDISEWLLEKSSSLPHGKGEVEVIIKQLKKGLTPETTSCAEEC
jgi:hydrogenase maturation protein HypF